MEIRIGTHRREEHDDDDGVPADRVDERERPPIQGYRLKVRSRIADPKGLGTDDGREREKEHRQNTRQPATHEFACRLEPDPFGQNLRTI